MLHIVCELNHCQVLTAIDVFLLLTVQRCCTWASLCTAKQITTTITTMQKIRSNQHGQRMDSYAVVFSWHMLHHIVHVMFALIFFLFSSVYAMCFVLLQLENVTFYFVANHNSSKNKRRGYFVSFPCFFASMSESKSNSYILHANIACVCVFVITQVLLS